jgi:DNA adenine methylase
MVRTRTRRRMSDQVSAYLSAIEGLPEIHDRLSRVIILNEDAQKLIQREDNELTLFYLDPPYPKESRTATNAYEHEMTDDDHHQLLDVLCNCQGKVMLSTYPNPIYDERLKDWNREDRVRDNKASGAKNKSVDPKTERLWMNF